MPEKGEITYLAPVECTPRGVLADAANKSDKYKTVIIIGVLNNEEEDIVLGHSTDSLINKIGLCDFAGHVFKEALFNG